MSPLERAELIVATLTPANVYGSKKSERVALVAKHITDAVAEAVGPDFDADTYMDEAITDGIAAEIAKRDAIEGPLVGAYASVFPNYAWTDAPTAIDLMKAEITTLRTELKTARAAMRMDSERLDHMEEAGRGSVRGTSYPQWRIEGEEGQSLRDAIDIEMSLIHRREPV